MRRSLAIGSVLVGLTFPLAAAESGSAPAGEGRRGALGVSADGRFFTLDGVPTFLLGASYYGALSISSEERLRLDLDDMVEDGFNWIRVWVFWDHEADNFSALEPDGRPREPYLARLKTLIEECAKRRMVVDCSLRRDAASARFPSSFEQHRACAESLARELLPYRNVYLDLANERDVGDARYVSIEEVGRLIGAVREVDPGRLCTASGVPRSAGDLQAMLTAGRCDFVAPHLCRDDGCAARTVETVTKYSRWMTEIGRTVPIHLQEPFRRGYGRYEPTADDFFRDASGAKAAGAAGWCLHNGSSRRSDDPRPHRSFLMTDEEGRLYEQWDDVERAVADGLLERLGGLSISTLRFQAEYPEQLPHLVGRRQGDAWAVEAGSDDAGFLNYGPYLDRLPAGRYRAAFRLRASPGAEGTATALTLDVFDADANKVLARRSVEAGDLRGDGEYREIVLELEHAGGGRRLEFRSWWHGTIGLQLDLVEVRR